MESTSTLLVKPVTLFTRVVFILASILAIIAGIQLYIFTDYTEHWFAWTIAAPLSAAFLGAGYWTGVTLLLLAVREHAWANIRIAIAGVGAFIPLMLLTTFLHLDRFHLNNPELSAWLAAWAWLIVYVTVPFPVLAILFIQRRTPGGDPPRLAPVPGWLRVLVVVNAAISLIVGLALFIFPEAMSAVWAWPLTPLTARAIGSGFLALVVASIQFIRENDWNRTRIGTIPYMLIGVLQLLAVARYPGTIEWSRPGSWLYILFMASILVGGLYSTTAAWRVFEPEAQKSSVI